MFWNDLDCKNIKYKFLLFIVSIEVGVDILMRHSLSWRERIIFLGIFEVFSSQCGHNWHKNLDFKDTLKELRNFFYAPVLCGHHFIEYEFIQVCIFYLCFWKTSFYVFLHPFVVTACSEFIVLFINFGNICIIITYIVGVRCFFLILFSHLNNLWEQMHVIKT